MAVRLLDTNIVSYLFKGHPLATAYRRHLVGYGLAASFQTVAELTEGATSAGWGAAKRAKLDTLISRLWVIHSDDAVCGRWAETRTALRSQPIGVADAWVAATALAHGLELVTHNPKDFRRVPGLIVVSEIP